MKVQKRIERLEELAEHYDEERMENQNEEPSEVIAMIRALGPKGFGELLRRIDGKTRGLPSERRQRPVEGDTHP